jgi:hypothetical protein
MSLNEVVFLRFNNDFLKIEGCATAIAVELNLR